MENNALSEWRAEKGITVEALASVLSVSKGTASKWSRRVPPERVPDVEAATGIPRHVLRPDLWEPPFITQE